MSVESVKEYLKQWNRDSDVQELEESSKTVELAAKAVGVIPARIAKSLTFHEENGCIMVVAAGDVKIDNQKFKLEFGKKAKMLKADEVIAITGHEIGGVCPFGLPSDQVHVYLDHSLKRFESIYVAAGTSYAVIKLNLEDLAVYSNALKWIDISQTENIMPKEKISYEKRISYEDTHETERQIQFMNQLHEYFSRLSKELDRPLTACVTTFGCQMNARDSEKMVGILEKIGYIMVEHEEADFVLYNTCTVRENANQRVYGRLGQLKKLKKKNPHMIIALCGCMMQESTVVEKIWESYRFVDIIFGTHNIFKLAELIQAKLDSDSMIIDIWKDTKEIVEDLPSERKYPFKAGVNIMYGCNNFCSYCIVPYVRGRERSRNPEDIIREIKDLVADGVVEIMLLGQNVNSYGKTLDQPMSFAQLLQEIEKISGVERIRFMTSHPKDLSDELIDVMKQSKKICNHLHLPVQSGSSRILACMNRHYTKEQYLDLVQKIKKAIPNISLTTDIIVGFPGETEEDFLETMDVVEQVRYDSAYTFIYSKRTGTPAAILEDQIEEAVIKDRFDRLLEKIQPISAELAQKNTGSIQSVLVEEVNGQDSSLVTGRMTNNLLVHFKGEASLIGSIVSVQLTECKGFYFIGKMVL